MNDIVLLPRFYRQIRLHLVANYLDMAVRPIILGIFGRTGDGKSIQLMAALERCGVEIVRVNAADLESALAGEPGKMVARTYASASLAVRKGIPTALVLDDVDTTVGEWELNTGTVNHQQVLAELMHVADRPVDPSRNQPCRVPIFVTGNNLARLYPPLRRHGRMAVMEWTPTRTEVSDVVATMFADLATADAREKLVAEFGAEPLAFFADVRYSVMEKRLVEWLENCTHDMRELLRQRSPAGLAWDGRVGLVDADTLLDVASQVRDRRAASLRDFLSEPVGGQE